MRPLVIGEQPGENTRADCPVHPIPRTGAGGRLARMLDLSPSKFLRAIDRINAVPVLDPAHGWAPQEALDNLAMLYNGGVFRDRRVLVLGARVRDVMGLNAGRWGVTKQVPAFRGYRSPRWANAELWTIIPHPSGRNRWYNHPDNKSAARALLAEWYTGAYPHE